MVLFKLLLKNGSQIIWIRIAKIRNWCSSKLAFNTKLLRKVNSESSKLGSRKLLKNRLEEWGILGEEGWEIKVRWRKLSCTWRMRSWRRLRWYEVLELRERI